MTAKGSSRQTVSVSGAVYAKLTARRDATGVSISQMVELACADLTGFEPRAPIAARRQTIPSIAGGTVVVLSRVTMDVSRSLEELLHDQVVRARQLEGREVTEGELLDIAINRMLDTAEAVIANARHCAICTTTRGPFRPMPSGPGYVAVCKVCDEEHPRSGRYAFDHGGTKGPPRVTDGNRRVTGAR